MFHQEHLSQQAPYLLVRDDEPKSKQVCCGRGLARVSLKVSDLWSTADLSQALLFGFHLRQPRIVSLTDAYGKKLLKPLGLESLCFFPSLAPLFLFLYCCSSLQT